MEGLWTRMWSAVTGEGGGGHLGRRTAE
jgi:hypothetical protein